MRHGEDRLDPADQTDGRTIGFVTVEQFREIEGDDAKSSLQLQLNRRCKSKQSVAPSNGGCAFLLCEFSDSYGRLSCETNTSTNNPAFERSCKRRKGYPSETKVKRGTRVVTAKKNSSKNSDATPVPVWLRRCFQALLPSHRQIRRHQPRPLFSASSQALCISGKSKRFGPQASFRLARLSGI